MIDVARWEMMSSSERRDSARKHFSRRLNARIGMCLEDLPDSNEIQIENWWDETMNASETQETIEEAVEEVVSDLMENGIMSNFF